jgi:molybdopterin-guanine dinucleotide biosynthesis protein A
LSFLRETSGLTAGVTGVILAGGQSRRMGSNKALLPYRGGRFIESIYQTMTALFTEVLLVTNTPEQHQFLPCPKVADIYQGMGALAGLHAGLYHSRSDQIFAVACDMPYLNTDAIRALLARRHQAAVIIPVSDRGPEPLHAVYSKACLAPMEQSLTSGKARIVSFFPLVNVHTITREHVATIDRDFSSFCNINTPAEYFELRKNESGVHESVYPAFVQSSIR